MARTFQRRREVGRPLDVLSELLERCSVSRVLVSLAYAVETRAAVGVPDHEVSDQAADYAAAIADAIRRMARGVEAAEERRAIP